MSRNCRIESRKIAIWFQLGMVWDASLRSRMQAEAAPPQPRSAGTDHILGVTCVGEHAADLLAEFVLAMKHGLGLNQILSTTHIYPTMTEANRYAAGAWKRGTVTQGQWAFLAAFHAWRRGAGGVGAVLGGVRPLLRDKRPAYSPDAH